MPEAPHVVENLPVRMDLTPAGINCRVQIQNVQTGEWHDISKYIRRVIVDAEVMEVTKVTIELVPYDWTMNVEGVAGIVKLLPSAPETNGSETSQVPEK